MKEASASVEAFFVSIFVLVSIVAVAERRKPSGAYRMNTAKPEGSRPAATNVQPTGKVGGKEQGFPRTTPSPYSGTILGLSITFRSSFRLLAC